MAFGVLVLEWELGGAVVGDVLGCGGLEGGAFHTLLPPQVLHPPSKYREDKPGNAVGYLPDMPKAV